MNSLTLIGVGLIGGSFALDLKRQGVVKQVFGVDIDDNNLKHALERNVIDNAMKMITKEAANADIIVLATPVSAIDKITKELASLIGQKTILLDVGSTKQKTIKAFEQYLNNHLPRCVAAHPIAGSDRSGALAARFGLFNGKKVVLCPHSHQDLSCLEKINELWQLLGADVYQMKAADHDAIFSAVSHLPHLLSYAYMYQIINDSNHADFLQFAASGFRDFTRISGSHPDIWADVCIENPEFIQKHLKQYMEQLQEIYNLLSNGNRQELHKLFSEAKFARDCWQEKQ